MNQQEQMMTIAFLAFLIESGCVIPEGETLDLRFRIAADNWFAILTVATPFGVATEYYQFDFKEWVKFNGGT